MYMHVLDYLSHKRIYTDTMYSHHSKTSDPFAMSLIFNVISLNDLTHYNPYVVVVFGFNSLRCHVVIRFVDIGGIQLLNYS
jgi:hypothetical protein